MYWESNWRPKQRTKTFDKNVQVNPLDPIQLLLVVYSINIRFTSEWVRTSGYEMKAYGQYEMKAYGQAMKRKPTGMETKREPNGKDSKENPTG